MRILISGAPSLSFFSSRISWRLMLEFLCVLPELPGHIDRRDEDQPAGDGEQGGGGETRGLRDARVQRLGAQREKLRRLFVQHRHRDDGDDQELRESLAELDGALRGEEAAEARSGRVA